MWYGRGEWGTVRAALGLAILLRCAAVVLAASACQQLDLAYSRNEEGSPRAAREVKVYGHTRILQVVDDGREPSRAAAALLATALRALARYRHVTLATMPPEGSLDAVCSLAWRMISSCEMIDTSSEIYNTLLLAPAIAWSGQRCPWFESCYNRKGDIMEMAPRLQAVGGSTAPAQLLLYAHLAPAAEARASCTHAQLWEFYTDPFHLYNCYFTREERSTLGTVYILSNQSNILERRIKNADLYLYVISRSELLNLLNERTSSFLFIDYDMWDSVPGVYKIQPPPLIDKNTGLTLDFNWSLRLADDFMLRALAPQTLQTLQRFLPTPTDIREVLDIEATAPQLGIEEAACSWAMVHQEKFKTWYVEEYKLQHRIAVFLCRDDPDKKEYQKVSKIVEDLYNSDTELNLGLYFVEIDCRSETELSTEFIKTTMSSSWLRLIGVAAAGMGARAAAALAPGVQTALLLYDVPAAGRRLRLHHATRTASGTVHHLVEAVEHFLSSNHWARLALISEDTELAKDISEAFRERHKLRVYNISVNGDLNESLQQLQRLNGRIFFVNASPDVAQNILCAAHELDMTGSEKYVWILREWRAVDIECSNGGTKHKPNMSHFTLSFWWRGGDHTQFVSKMSPQNKTNKILLSALNKLWPESTWPPLAAPLANSLELLIKSFKTFTKLYPQRYFELHGNGSVKLLLESLKNDATVGVMQTFEYINGSLSQPLIFLNKWMGNRSETIFMWHAQADGLQVVTRVKDTYGDDNLSDGSQYCLTNASNELFYARCNDFVWLGALCFAMVAFFGLYMARRIRLKRLAKRDALLTAQLLAQRDFVSSALAEHYVDRAALELYEYISQGCIGRVRYAILRAPERHPISVAVKELRDDVPMTDEDQLLREACTLSMLTHDHIVRLIGICATGGPLLVLLEFAFFGNLCDYLCERRHLLESATGTEENNESYHVSATSLTRLAREAASALAYLALQRIVHRDIRAVNCLVDDRRSLKLAGFGLARKTGTGAAGEGEYLTRRRGLFPVLWMAPESLERGVFSAASDAWALGVLLLELVTLGARPYGTWLPQRVLRYVSAGGRPPLPPDISETTQSILSQCWRREPEARASVAAVAARLAAEPEALHPALHPAPPPTDEDCPTIYDDDVPTSGMTPHNDGEQT